jgi:hypothetical protein
MFVCRGDQQVNMVRHQRVGMDGATIALRAFLQAMPIRKIVFVGEEGGLAVVAALHHVVRHASGGYSCAARHGLSTFGLM